MIKECDACEGKGWNAVPQMVCCGRGFNACCGEPDIDLSQELCGWCDGSGVIEHQTLERALSDETHQETLKEPDHPA